MDSSRKTFVLASFVLFLNLFFFRSFDGLGLGILLAGTASALIAAFVPLSKLNKHLSQAGLFALTIGLFVIILTTRANPTVTHLVKVLSINFLLLTLYTIKNERVVRNSFELIMLPITLFLEYIGAFGEMISKKFFNKPVTADNVVFIPQQGKKAWVSILTGLMFAIPVIFILVVLLSQADPIFGKITNDFLNSPFIKELTPRTIWSLVAIIVLAPVLFMKATEKFGSTFGSLQKSNFVNEYSVMMGAVASILGIFLIIQWQYIFIPGVKGVDLSQFGFNTYSEYVTKGFVEALIASFFIYGLVWIGLFVLKTQDEMNKRFLRIAQTAVLVEFIFFLISIFRRIYLYQHFHGLTLIRVYGGFFVLLLLGYTVVLIGRHLATRRWVLADIAITLLLVSSLALFNVEAAIVQKPPTVNGQVDYTYLARLSADGYNGWKAGYNNVESVLSSPALIEKVTLSLNASKDSSNPYIPFTDKDRRDISYSGIVLEKLMDNYHTLITKYGSPDEIKDYYSKILLYSIRRTDIALEDYVYNAPTEAFSTPEASAANSLRKSKLTDFKNTLSEALKNDASNIELTFYSPVNYLYRVSSTGDSLTSDPCLIYAICSSLPYYAANSSPHTFYFINIGGKDNQDSLLSKVLNWNTSEYSAYLKTRSEMPIQELLSLQEKYFDALRQTRNAYIHGYKNIEQGGIIMKAKYDTDVNLNVPFLKPL